MSRTTLRFLDQNLLPSLFSCCIVFGQWLWPPHRTTLDTFSDSVTLENFWDLHLLPLSRVTFFGVVASLVHCILRFKLSWQRITNREVYLCTPGYMTASPTHKYHSDEFRVYDGTVRTSIGVFPAHAVSERSTFCGPPTAELRWCTQSPIVLWPERLRFLTWRTRYAISANVLTLNKNRVFIW